MTAPGNLPTAWRYRAGELERYAPAAAEAFRTAARDLEAALRAAADELLTLDQGAEVSGYSKRRLRELIAEEKVPNAGRHGAPRIRRADLPMRPGVTAISPANGYDVDEDAAGLLGRVR